MALLSPSKKYFMLTDVIYEQIVPQPTPNEGEDRGNEQSGGEYGGL